MERQTALRMQLRIQVYALVALLRRPEADPRRVWTIADAVLDSHDASQADHAALRGEVCHLMHAIASRRDVNAAAVADRLKAFTDAISPNPKPAVALAG
ncbi:MAG: hypothetical protein JWM27_4798 [Gemmatimonadetes bacterium]|nr:hypothetical protein [Gemmatimonadota bacterium]